MIGINILLGSLLIVVTIGIHVLLTRFIIFVIHVRSDPKYKHINFTKEYRIAITVLIIFAAAIVEAIVWAATYMKIGAIQTFTDALYFSIVTFTTLGYGDITLMDHKWRLLSGIEALDGILLVGWTTALLFMVVQRSWKNAGYDHTGE